MSVIYNGIEYPTRDLSVVDSDGVRRDITIAGEDLEAVLLDHNSTPVNKVAEAIDDDIYFYVEDMNMSDEEIAATGLDEPMTLAEEEKDDLTTEELAKAICDIIHQDGDEVSDGDVIDQIADLLKSQGLFTERA